VTSFREQGRRKGRRGAKGGERMAKKRLIDPRNSSKVPFPIQQFK